VLARLAERWEPSVSWARWGTDRETAARLLARVQVLPYWHDPPGPVDLVCKTARCVLEQGGDCEDRSTLLAALYAEAGLSARLAWLTQPGAMEDHVSTQVRVDGVWLWADSTVEGAELGEHPRDAYRRLGRVRRDPVRRVVA
jgi:transglutaminase-like putative cysteine protease